MKRHVRARAYRGPRGNRKEDGKRLASELELECSVRGVVWVWDIYIRMRQGSRTTYDYNRCSLLFVVAVIIAGKDKKRQDKKRKGKG